jgi:hypothetical protein
MPDPRHLHREAGVTLEFRERRVLPHAGASSREMDERLTRVAATDGENCEACLRPGVARGVSRDFAEIHRCQGLDTEIEAEVAERRPEPRPVFLRECLGRYRILQAEHGAPGGIGVNRREGANPGKAGPGIGRVEHLRALGGRQRAAEVALGIERLGFGTPARSVLRILRRRGEYDCRDQRDRQTHAAIPLSCRPSCIIAAFRATLTCAS